MQKPVPLHTLTPGSQFRMAYSPYRTGTLIRTGIGSVTVEYHSVLRAVKSKSSKVESYKAVIWIRGERVHIAPDSEVHPIAVRATRYDDSPAFRGVPLIRSAADVASEGWDLPGIAIAGFVAQVTLGASRIEAELAGRTAPRTSEGVIPESAAMERVVAADEVSADETGTEDPDASADLRAEPAVSAHAAGDSANPDAGIEQDATAQGQDTLAL